VRRSGSRRGVRAALLVVLSRGRSACGGGVTMGTGTNGISSPGSLGTFVDPNADTAAASFPLPKVVQTPAVAGGLPITYEGPTIAGQSMPGQWLLTKVVRSFEWQQQQAAFTGGAALAASGIPLAEIEYSISIWEPGAAVLYRKLLGTLFSKAVAIVPGSNGTSTIAQTGASAAALGIDDPSLKDLGITTVVLKSITPLFNPLVGSGGKGPWTATATFLEYRQPFKLPPLPDQTIPDNGAVTPANQTNLATAQAAIQAGDAQRQQVLATMLLNKNT
jgi:hypothetical protein